MAPLWATYGNFGQLFITTYSHTVHCLLFKTMSIAFFINNFDRTNNNNGRLGRDLSVKIASYQFSLGSQTQAAMDTGRGLDLGQVSNRLIW